MDLPHWAQRAETELRATGRTARPRRLLAEEPLTSQETRVAVLAAQGLSNREIAAMLFLSPKTVEHHLSSVYRKRGPAFPRPAGARLPDRRWVTGSAAAFLRVRPAGAGR